MFWNFNSHHSVLSISNMSVLVSMFEGIPRALMESMAFGIPVITTNVPGSRQLVIHEKTGILVEYGHIDALKNALLKLINDDIYAKALGDKGKESIIKNHDEIKVSENILNIYKFILERKCL